MTAPPVPRTRIKICGLTREADVDAAVEAGADAIGFVLYREEPPRRDTPSAPPNWPRACRPFVTPVLLFVNEDAPEVDSSTQPREGRHRAVPRRRDARTVRGSQRPGRFRYMRAARIPLGAAGAGFDLVKYASDYSHAQAILLDAHVEGYGGGGKAFDWSLLPPAVDAHLVLSGGLTPANVSDGIRSLRTRCKTLSVDVSSGVEIDGPGTRASRTPERSGNSSQPSGRPTRPSPVSRRSRSLSGCGSPIENHAKPIPGLPATRCHAAISATTAAPSRAKR